MEPFILQDGGLLDIEVLSISCTQPTIIKNCTIKTLKIILKTGVKIILDNCSFEKPDNISAVKIIMENGATILDCDEKDYTEMLPDFVDVQFIGASA